MFNRRRGESDQDYGNRMEAYITLATAFFLILAVMLLYSLSSTVPELGRQQVSNLIGACRHCAHHQAAPDAR